MAQETLAPWGEVVPGDRRMTVDELLALPDDSRMYGLVEGRLVRMPLGGGEASRIGLRLGAALVNFVEDRGLGAVTESDGTCNLTPAGETAETALVPDLAFVRAERVPPAGTTEYAKAWHLAPDLVVEVASPSQFRPEMKAKALLYLKSGVRLLWVVWPKARQVDVWRPGADEPVATLGSGDALDGMDVLPGFSYPLVRLFA